MKIALFALAFAAMGTAAYGGSSPIAPNSTIHGRLEPGDPKRNGDWVDTYYYDGQAGEELFVDMPNVNQYIVRLNIEGPGKLSDKNCQMTWCVVRLPQRGRYKIMVSADGAYDYDLIVSRVIEGQTQSVLNAGQSVQGGFSSSDLTKGGGPVDTYSYVARAGEAISVHVEAQLGVTMEVPGARQDRRLALGKRVSDLPVYFPTAGTYPIILSGIAGNYTLSARPVPTSTAAIPAKQLLLGETVHSTFQPTGPINERGDAVNVYTFNAAKGDKLMLIVKPQSTIGATVIGPDGREVRGELAYEDKAKLTTRQVEIPVSGTYRIETPSRPDVDYTLQLTDASGGQAVLAATRADADRQYAAEQAHSQAQKAHAAALVQQGNQLLGNGAAEEALEAFSEAIQLDADNVDAHMGFAMSYFAEGKYGWAAIDFEQVLRMDPGNKVAAEYLARSKQGDQAAAERFRRERAQKNADFLAGAVGAAVGSYTATVAANSPPSRSIGSAGPEGSTGPLAGPNSCAEKIGRTLRNNCDYMIDVVMDTPSIRQHGGESTETITLAPHTGVTHNLDSIILLSCNVNMAEHHAAFRDGTGYICR